MAIPQHPFRLRDLDTAADVPARLTIPSPAVGLAGASVLSSMTPRTALWSMRGAHLGVTPRFMRTLPKAVFEAQMGTLGRITGFLDKGDLLALARTCTKARKHVFASLWKYYRHEGDSYLLPVVEKVRRKHFPDVSPSSPAHDVRGLVTQVNREVIDAAFCIKFHGQGLSLRRRYQMAQIEAGVCDAIHPLDKEGTQRTPLNKAALEVLCWGREMAERIKIQERLNACLCFSARGRGKAHVQALNASCELTSSHHVMLRQMQEETVALYPEWYRENKDLLTPLFYAFLIFSRQEKEFYTFLDTLADSCAQEFKQVFTQAVKACRRNMEKHYDMLGGWALEGWMLDVLFEFHGNVQDIVPVFDSIAKQNEGLAATDQLRELLRRPSITELNEWLDAHMNRNTGVQEGTIKPFSLLRAFICCKDEGLQAVFYKKIQRLATPLIDSFHQGLVSPNALKQWVVEALCSFKRDTWQIFPVFEEIARQNATLAINTGLRELLSEYTRSRWADRDQRMTALKEWLRAHAADLDFNVLLDAFALTKSDTLQEEFFLRLSPSEGSAIQLRPEQLAVLFSKYLKVYSKEEPLGPLLPRLPLPAHLPRAAIPQIQSFVTLVSEKKADKVAANQKAWLEDPATKERIRSRDYFVMAHVIMDSIKYDLLFEKEVLDLIEEVEARSRDLSPSLTEEEFRIKLQELTSTFAGIKQKMQQLFPLVATDARLQEVTLALMEAETRPLEIDEARAEVLKDLYRDFSDVWEEKVKAMVDTRSVGESCKRVPVSEEFSSELARVQMWMEDPANVFLFSSITKLDLSGRGLRFIPSTLLDKVQSVTRLDLSENALEEVPAEIEKFSRLQELKLFSNFITEVPDFVFNLPNLRGLWMSNCYIHTLQKASLLRQEHLATLDLSHNCLKAIPPDFLVRFPLLARASFAHNNLRSLPENMGNVNWTALDLSSNDFLRKRSIPEAVSSSHNAVLQAALKPYLRLSHERRYEPQEPMAKFYQTVLFRKSEAQVREAFQNLVEEDRDSICESLWHFWRSRQELGLQQLEAVTLEEGLIRAEAHLCDDAQLLCDIVCHMVVRAFHREPLEQKGILTNYLQRLSVVTGEEQQEARAYFAHLTNTRPSDDLRTGELADKVLEAFSVFMDVVLEEDLIVEPVRDLYEIDRMPRGW